MHMALRVFRGGGAVLSEETALQWEPLGLAQYRSRAGSEAMAVGTHKRLVRCPGEPRTEFTVVKVSQSSKDNGGQSEPRLCQPRGSSTAWRQVGPS